MKGEEQNRDVGRVGWEGGRGERKRGRERGSVGGSK